MGDAGFAVGIWPMVEVRISLAAGWAQWELQKSSMNAENFCCLWRFLVEGQEFVAGQYGHSRKAPAVLYSISCDGLERRRIQRTQSGTRLHSKLVVRTSLPFLVFQSYFH